MKKKWACWWCWCCCCDIDQFGLFLQYTPLTEVNTWALTLQHAIFEEEEKKRLMQIERKSMEKKHTNSPPISCVVQQIKSTMRYVCYGMKCVLNETSMLNKSYTAFRKINLERNVCAQDEEVDDDERKKQEATNIAWEICTLIHLEYCFLFDCFTIYSANSLYWFFCQR